MSQKVNISIAGRNYPLSVQIDEEEVLRRAAGRMDSLVKDFEKNYQITDKQDALAMSALQVATQLEVLLKANENDKVSVLQKIDKIIQLIDETKD